MKVVNRRSAPQPPTCPKCGNSDMTEINFLEDITSYRLGQEARADGRLRVQCYYRTDKGYDEGGHNMRWECRAMADDDAPCYEQWSITEDEYKRIDWV